MDRTEIIERLKQLPGDVGFWYKNLVTGESFGLRENELFLAASVIKLPVYCAIMAMCHEGLADMGEKLLCRQEDKMPPCGALYFFTGDVETDIRTLCGLMISLSDNTATNLLLRRFGLEELNTRFKAMGLERTRLERLLFDSGAAARGLENRIVLKELGELLEKIYRREFLSEQLSREIEDLLLLQQINHKIPGYLPEGIPVAHKTGEDEGITNDVGIVYAKEPFILCFAANRTRVPRAETALREISLALCCPD